MLTGQQPWPGTGGPALAAHTQAGRLPLAYSLTDSERLFAFHFLTNAPIPPIPLCARPILGTEETEINAPINTAQDHIRPQQ